MPYISAHIYLLISEYTCSGKTCGIRIQRLALHVGNCAKHRFVEVLAKTNLNVLLSEVKVLCNLFPLLHTGKLVLDKLLLQVQQLLGCKHSPGFLDTPTF